MARERLPMRKILEILRLRWVLGLTVRETTRALQVSTGVVSSSTERAASALLTYVSAVGMLYEDLEAQTYPRPVPRREHEEPDVV